MLGAIAIPQIVCVFHSATFIILKPTIAKDWEQLPHLLLRCCCGSDPPGYSACARKRNANHRKFPSVYPVIRNQTLSRYFVRSPPLDQECTDLHRERHSERFIEWIPCPCRDRSLQHLQFPQEMVECRNFLYKMDLNKSNESLFPLSTQ